MIKLKNKRANEGEMYLSIWMFIIWIAIVAALAWGIMLFNSEQSDIRYREAYLLSNRIIECLADNFDSSKAENFDIYAAGCGLSKAVIEDSGDFYINFTIRDKSSGKSVYTFDRGTSVWFTDCEYQKKNKKIEKNFAQCSYQTLEYLGKNEDSYTINILTATNKH